MLRLTSYRDEPHDGARAPRIRGDRSDDYTLADGDRQIKRRAKRVSMRLIVDKERRGA